MRFTTRQLVAVILIVLVGALGIFALSAAASTTAPEVEKMEKQVELQFITHLDGGMAEQDVFVEVEPGSAQVKRIVADEVEAYRNVIVFSSDRTVDHDPFQVKSEPIGPYPKGQDLGFTMDEWLQASATGTYAVSGNRAEISISASNLVPNGTYTVWCAYVHVPPAYKIVDEPCGKTDGSENQLIVDENGNGEFNLSLAKLPDATETMLPVIALAYHSDGKVYGPHPGNFGLNSHVQILAFIPAPGDDAWQPVSNN